MRTLSGITWWFDASILLEKRGDVSAAQPNDHHVLPTLSHDPDPFKRRNALLRMTTGSRLWSRHSDPFWQFPNHLSRGCEDIVKFLLSSFATVARDRQTNRFCLMPITTRDLRCLAHTHSPGPQTWRGRNR